MIILMKQVLVFLIIQCCALIMRAQQLELSPIFASNMVIQQQSDVEVWGWTAPKSKVSLKCSWTKQKRTAISDAHGKWKIMIQTPKASYTPLEMIIISGKDCVVLTNILAGDVWLLGGQSNMQMSLNGNPDQPTKNAQQILLRSNRNGIRLFRVQSDWAIECSDTLRADGEWALADPAHVREFSAVGYLFGEILNSLIDIPIGLVQVAHGGSTVEAWIDRNSLAGIEGLQLNLDESKIDPIWYGASPFLLYNKMFHPLLPIKVKGVVWYQGESNVERPEQYRTLFPLLISSWRRYLRDDNLPFYYTQIAPYNYANANSALLREVQLQVMQQVPHTGMAVTLDVGEPDVIHPSDKETVAERLAYWALNKTYGISAFECRGPEWKTINIVDGHLFLTFDYAPNGLSFFGKEVSGFEVAGDDKVFYPANARIKPSFWGNEGLEVWSEEVKNPVAVRYGFRNYVDGCLYNTFGLPASSFRTDDWKFE